MNRQEPTILIAYPKEFICDIKFERKVGRILSRLPYFSLAKISDDNNFISRIASNDKRVHDVLTLTKDAIHEQVTHAIVFDDGESFIDIFGELKQKGVEPRIIDTKITRVVNIDKTKKFDVYIGRGSDWGNPYVIGVDGDRADVIRKYQYDFERGYLKSSKEQLLKLRGKTLGCHCKPAACHGDILVDYLNSLDDGK